MCWLSDYEGLVEISHRRRKKKEGDEDDEWVFHLVYYKCFRRKENITELGGDYKEVGDWVVDVSIWLCGILGGSLF